MKKLLFGTVLVFVIVILVLFAPQIKKALREFYEGYTGRLWR